MANLLNWWMNLSQHNLLRCFKAESLLARSKNQLDDLDQLRAAKRLMRLAFTLCSATARFAAESHLRKRSEL